jgi:hypothetical protein
VIRFEIFDFRFSLEEKVQMKDFSQRTKLLFRKTGLLENLAKGSGRQRAGMHGDVSLSSVWMPQNFVAPGLSSLYKASTEELCQDLTGGVRHQGFRRGRSGILLQWVQTRREPFSPQSRSLSIPSRRRVLPQCPGHASSNRARGRVHNSSPEIPARLQVQETQNSAQ